MDGDTTGWAAAASEPWWHDEPDPYPQVPADGRRWDDLLDEVIDDGRHRYGDGYGYRRQMLTQLTFVGDRLVDSLRRPVEGSGYEELARDLAQRARPPEPPKPPGHELQLAWLATVVGGEEALAALTDHPLPREELRLDGVPPRLHERLRVLEALVCEPAEQCLGAEGPTAVRRFLVRLAQRSPGILLRTERIDLSAAAVLWAVARGSDLAGPGRALRPQMVQDLLGTRSSPNQRATTYAHAVGGGTGGFGRYGYYGAQAPDVLPLGDPDLLLGVFRGRVIGLRDRAVDLRARTPAA